MPPTVSQTFGLLCEGWDNAFVPEVAYVRQGRNVYFYLGKPSQLTESLDEGTTILESESGLEMVEVAGSDGAKHKTVKDGQWVVEGPFQRSDVKNANGRTYSRKIWERIIADAKSPFMQDLRAGGGLGHLEHPQDGRTDGAKGAIINRDLKLKEDGVVWGKAEILDTPHGLILQEYTRKGVRWGVSSRGNGSVNNNGQVNENDFQLTTFDAVMRPSTLGAYPKPVNASKTESQGGTNESETGDDSLSDDARVFLESVRELTADDAVDESDLTSRLSFARRLLDKCSQTSGKLASGTLTAMQGSEVFNCLVKRLNTLQELAEANPVGSVESLVESLTEQADAPATDRAIEEMTRQFNAQVQAVTDECDTLRNQVTALTQDHAVLQASKDELTALWESALADVDAAQSQVKNLESRLAVANESIQALTEMTVTDSVQEAVNEAVTANPQLVPVRELLESSPDASTVTLRVKQLLGLSGPATKTPANNTAGPVAERRTLPKGDVVSESVRGPADARSVGAGPKLVGAVLSKKA